MNYIAVVISGELGSGTDYVSEKVAERLIWGRYSTLDEMKKTWKERYPNAEVSFPIYWASMNDNKKRMRREKEAALEGGHVVMDVEYCKDLIGEPCVLSVFLKATNGVRAKRLYGKTSSKVLTDLCMEEQRQRAEGQRLFEYDPRTLSYDFTFDSGSVELSTIVNVIVAAVRGDSIDVNEPPLRIVPDAFK